MSLFNGTGYDVDGKVVLVTGAAGGIGAALASTLHGRGASVALLDVDADAVRARALELGSGALPLVADVRDRESMAASTQQVVDRFGRLDVVVANAGVAPPPSTLRTIDEAEFDRVIGINLTGVFNTVRPAMEQVIAHRGHMVVVSSAAAFAPGAGLASYMASKAGVEQLGRALRIELAAVGASAGVAYFGVVTTALARPLDEDPLARRFDSLLPWPFNERITAETAATVVADGITRRAATTFAPAAWQPYSLLRGAANVVIDGQAAGSRALHELIREVEQRAAQTAQDDGTTTSRSVDSP